MTNREKVFVAVFGLMLAAATCAKSVIPDKAMAAVEAGDRTALIQGCGNQLVQGYTYCRKMEGEASNEAIHFVGPPAQCLGDKPCVTFKVYFPDGSPAYGDSIPRGKTSVAVLWKELIKKDQFTVGDRGFWPFEYEIRWIGEDQREYLTKSEGEIRLRVVRKEYVPLNEVKDDQNFVWSWMENGVQVKMTTGARTYVGEQ